MKINLTGTVYFILKAFIEQFSFLDPTVPSLGIKEILLWKQAMAHTTLPVHESVVEAAAVATAESESGNRKHRKSDMPINFRHMLFLFMIITLR